MKYIFIFALGVATCFNTYGDTMYKYRDKNGNYVFSDKKPETQHEVIEKGNYKGSKKVDEESIEPQPTPPTRLMESVRPIIEGIKPEINELYKQLFIADKETQGKVVVAFSISKEGNVTSCNEDESGMTRPGFNGKICEKIQSLNYGIVEESKPVDIKYSYNFKPNT